ncbi:uncharacterized protein tmem174 [Engraulis encrasicolus]|uniref:uncharacterized protein tmem174 n=1 Tax=Engraulis encrasicolus TaxID=184585 RepID=UPI002FD04846
MKRFGLKSLWKAVIGAGQAAGGPPPPPVAMGTPGTGTGTDYNPSTGQYSHTSTSTSTSTSTGLDTTELPQSVISSLPSMVAPVVGRSVGGGGGGGGGGPGGGGESQVSDMHKTGATLLFSGIFLALVGMTFTAMGWINYDVSHAFEWTQLLGPVLLSVGGTFVLISICKFRMLSCKNCKQQREDCGEGGTGGGGRPDDSPELPLHHHLGQSFVFSGINQPITFHRATVVQYIPPPYASVTQDLGAGDAQTAQLAANSPPQYYSVCQLECPAQTVPGAVDSRRASNVSMAPSVPGSESRRASNVSMAPSLLSSRRASSDSLAFTVPTTRRASRIPVLQELEEEKKDTNEDSVFPPAYEDLFPDLPSSSNI